jgi:hypothetical protein
VDEHLPEDFYDLREVVVRLEEKLAARDIALNLANETLKAWQANSNEWRGALSDNNRRFATSDEVKAMLEKEQAKREALEDKLDALEKSRAAVEGKSSGFNASWGIALALGGFVLLALEVYAALRR